MRKYATSYPDVKVYRTVSLAKTYPIMTSSSRKLRHIRTMKKRACFFLSLSAVIFIFLLLVSSGARFNTRPRLERISMPNAMPSKLERQDVNMYEPKRAPVHAPKEKIPAELSAAPAHEDPTRSSTQKSTERPDTPEKGTEMKKEPATAKYDDEGLAILSWSARDRSELKEPTECRQWRLAAKDPQQLTLYRDHFVSHDFMDWFVYAAFFTEMWHTTQNKRRPVYLDVAANHARRWSGTYFLDRCMGWEGICVEANEKYWEELHAERHCKVVEKCVSDRERTVNFSLTDAYGGVVLGEGVGGVNGSMHETESKYKGQFRGIKQMKCSTLGKEVGVKHVHFWSLDVEGHELEVLRGFDWKKTSVDVIVTENRGKEVRAILSGRGYEQVSKVLKDDIWIRNGSGFEVSERMRQLMRSLDKSSYRFFGV